MPNICDQDDLDTVQAHQPVDDLLANLARLTATAAGLGEVLADAPGLLAEGDAEVLAREVGRLADRLEGLVEVAAREA